MAVDQIASDSPFSPWRNKFQAELSDGVLDGKVILLKPQTFMNLSGQSVGEAMRFYKLTPSDITVFHDELDIAPGKCRVKMGGGHAGHNGLRSVHQHIGPDYQRIGRALAIRVAKTAWPNTCWGISPKQIKTGSTT